MVESEPRSSKGSGKDRSTENQACEGIVVAIEPRRMTIQIGARRIDCDVRRGLLYGKRSQRNLAAIGDRVRLEITPEGYGVLSEVLPSRSRISRIGSLKPIREHVIAANVDQLLSMQSVLNPRFNARGLDRFLVLGEVGGVDCSICLNKIDLAKPGQSDKLIAVYAKTNYPIFKTSAADGEGLGAVADYLKDKTTLILGPSGAGKSTLLNQLIPGLDLRTCEISASTGRGVHTTTRVNYLELPGGGVVIDSPGLRSIQPYTLPVRLAEAFPEMRPWIGKCKFRDCIHHTEPGCKIRERLSEGEIDPARYDSYLRMVTGLKEDLKNIDTLPGFEPS